MDDRSTACCQLTATKLNATSPRLLVAVARFHIISSDVLVLWWIVDAGLGIKVRNALDADAAVIYKW